MNDKKQTLLNIRVYPRMRTSAKADVSIKIVKFFWHDNVHPNLQNITLRIEPCDYDKQVDFVNTSVTTLRRSGNYASSNTVGTGTLYDR